jgi:serine/threonine protein kinase
VAVKAFRLDIVPEDAARLAEALRRLVTADLTRAGIVPVLDAGLEGASAFLAVDYVAGETLDVAFRHLAPAPLDRALPMLAQIARAIDAAWAAGFGHGALHPRDVFLTSTPDEVLITGFGVVPALEAIGVKPPVRRPYAAPERVAGGPWDIRADVFALGAITHELLTRRRPAGPGEQDGTLAVGVSAEQQGFVRRVLAIALAERAEDRFASAGAFIDALVEVQAGRTPDVAALAPRDLRDPMTTVVPPLTSTADAGDLEIGEVEDGDVASDESHVEVEIEGPPPIKQARLFDEVNLVTDSTEDVASNGRTRAPEAAAEIHRDRRPLPPALFGSSPPPVPFPWAAVVAVAVAGLALGGVVGYQLGFLKGRAPAGAGVVTAASPTDTDVPVSPPPAPPPAAPATPPPTPVTETPPAPVAEPTATPPPVPATGRLVVQSAPAGALITIDGRPHGMTPQTLRNLAFGRHTLKIARPGYLPRSTQLELTERQPSRTVSVTLEPGADARAAGTGSISVDTRPRGARVFLDGKVVGTTPLKLPGIKAGPHAVRIELAGYKSISTNVTVKAGAETAVAVTLEPAGRRPIADRYVSGGAWTPYSR